MKAYEEKNKYVMDLLYGFIEFNKFKTDIIAYKKGPMLQSDNERLKAN